MTKTSELYAIAYKRRNSSFRLKDKSRKCFDFSKTTIFVQSWADSLVGCRLWAHQWESGLLECSFLCGRTSVQNILFQNNCRSFEQYKWIANFHSKITTNLKNPTQYKKKSQNGDTLGPVELIVWPEQVNQGDQGDRHEHDKGHSCRIGIMCPLGTSEFYNCQFNEVGNFCFLFISIPCIWIKKYQGEPYCT